MSNEFEQSLNLSRYAHDRDSARRLVEGNIQQAWDRESTRVILLHKGRSLGRPVQGIDSHPRSVTLDYLRPRDVDAMSGAVVERL